MKYVKSCLIITMLLGVGYSQCNESNWQEYFPFMQGCQLVDADLAGANLSNANLNETVIGYSEFFGANLSCATLNGADLYETWLANTTWDDPCITNDNGDSYDDVSYEAGAESGDLNLDGVNNVLDVVILANNILNP